MNQVITPYLKMVGEIQDMIKRLWELSGEMDEKQRLVILDVIKQLETL